MHFQQVWYHNAVCKMPLESSCVVFASTENYNTSKSLHVSPEKSQILSCDTLVAKERYVFYIPVFKDYLNLCSRSTNARH